MYRLKIVVVVLSFFVSAGLGAQVPHKVNGRITDAKTGEVCAGTVIRVLDVHNLWTVTDNAGAFVMDLPGNQMSIEFSYVGYAPDTLLWHRDMPNPLEIKLKPLAYTLSSVTVLGENSRSRLQKPEMSLEKIDQKIIQKVPVLLGEKDLIKVVQLLPGVQSTSEGSSAFNVRGGSPDQNLVLWDEASLYNISHMLGFFSVFNNDAVQGMSLYKGDIPAAYGGRLSSLLNVEARSGQPNFAVQGGIGLIASRLCIEGNMGHPNLTFLLAGRRTYADVFLPLFPDQTVKTSRINFYDGNAKVNWRIGKRNYLSLTFYNGRDRFKADDTGVDYGNTAATLSWRTSFSPSFYLKTSLIASRYGYKFLGSTETLRMTWKADIKNAQFRTDATWLPAEGLRLQFGYHSDFQWFRPGDAEGRTRVSGVGVTQSIHMSRRQSWVNTLYFSNEHNFWEGRVNLRYSLRLNRFDAVGPTTLYTTDEHYNLVNPEGEKIASGKMFHHHYSLEPRAGISFVIRDRMSVKAFFARTVQYTHLLSFSSAGSPLEIWVPSNPTIRPQIADQYSLGFFHNFMGGRIETSAEVFYKNLRNVLDYKEHPNLLLYDKLETELRFGQGKSYGLELMLRKTEGRLSGWVSYTYSRSRRTIDGVNGGMSYPSPSDRPHSVALVCFYELNRRWNFSMNWVYATGRPITLPEGRYWFENELVPVYSGRNRYRLPDYHRLDIAATVVLGRLNRRFSHEISMGVYNVYARKNPWAVNYRLRPDGRQYLQMTYLFSVIPSVSWNFKF